MSAYSASKAAVRNLARTTCELYIEVQAEREAAAAGADKELANA